MDSIKYRTDVVRPPDTSKSWDLESNKYVVLLHAVFKLREDELNIWHCLISLLTRTMNAWFLKLDGSLLKNASLASYEVYKGSLRLDGQTISNLEIFQNNADGGKTGKIHQQ
jgi:DNA mismatch repair ATPase MutS